MYAVNEYLNKVLTDGLYLSILSIKYTIAKVKPSTKRVIRNVAPKLKEFA